VSPLGVVEDPHVCGDTSAQPGGGPVGDSNVLTRRRFRLQPALRVISPPPHPGTVSYRCHSRRTLSNTTTMPTTSSRWPRCPGRPGVVVV